MCEFLWFDYSDHIHDQMNNIDFIRPCWNSRAIIICYNSWCCNAHSRNNSVAWVLLVCNPLPLKSKLMHIWLYFLMPQCIAYMTSRLCYNVTSIIWNKWALQQLKSVIDPWSHNKATTVQTGSWHDRQLCLFSINTQWSSCKWYHFLCMSVSWRPYHVGVHQCMYSTQ